MRIDETAIRTKNVTIQVTSMTKNGTFKLGFKQKCSQFIPEITNQTMKVVLQKNLSEPLPVIFINQYIKDKDGNDTNIVDPSKTIYQLIFDDFDTVSVTDNLDVARLEFQEDIYCKQLSEYYVIKKGTIIEREIPFHFITEVFINPTLQQAIASGTSVAMLAFNQLINALAQNGLAYLWGTLNFLSFLTVISLVSANTPDSLATDLINLVYKLAQLDILPAPLIFDYTFEFEDDTDSSYTEQFDKLGMDSLNAIKIMGSSYIFLNFYFALLIYIYIERKIVARYKIQLKWMRWKWLRTKYSNFIKGFIWNGFVRGLIQQYPTVQISAMLNLRRFNSEGTGESMASVITVPLLLMSIALPFALHLLVYKNRENIGEPEWIEKFGTLTDNLNIEKPKAIYWNIIQLYRFFFVNICLMSFPSQPYVQLGLIFLFQLAVNWYIWKVQPFTKKLDNVGEKLNCIFTQTYIVFYLGLVVTDQEEPDPRTINFKLRAIFTWALGAILGIATITSIIMLLAANTKIFSMWRRDRKIAQRVAKQMFEKYKIDVINVPKDISRWSFKQLFDYLLAQATDSRLEDIIRSIQEGYEDMSIVLNLRQRNNLRELLKRIDEFPISQILLTLNPYLNHDKVIWLDKFEKKLAKQSLKYSIRRSKKVQVIVQPHLDQDESQNMQEDNTLQRLGMSSQRQHKLRQYLLELIANKKADVDAGSDQKLFALRQVILSHVQSNALSIEFNDVQDFSQSDIDEISAEFGIYFGDSSSPEGRTARDASGFGSYIPRKSEGPLPPPTEENWGQVDDSQKHPPISKALLANSAQVYGDQQFNSLKFMQKNDLNSEDQWGNFKKTKKDSNSENINQWQDSERVDQGTTAMGSNANRRDLETLIIEEFLDELDSIKMLLHKSLKKFLEEHNETLRQQLQNEEENEKELFPEAERKRGLFSINVQPVHKQEQHEDEQITPKIQLFQSNASSGGPSIWGFSKRKVKPLASSKAISPKKSRW
ncbi:hypothetical protein FGO68_gene6406 [Halteria grandinella]|uniref:Uncharacterized protein n=1 Tax=Halteria grandinella TaxID=5974 RepID=A0A8J8NFB3_HALGN|nr:hypothetical protein FGO68_gene6406 [Halteria grandinella]